MEKQNGGVCVLLFNINVLVIILQFIYPSDAISPICEVVQDALPLNIFQIEESLCLFIVQECLYDIHESGCNIDNC